MNQLLNRWKESLKDQWAKKVFQDENPQACAVSNAAALAQIEMLDKLIDLDVVAIEDSFRDEQ